MTILARRRSRTALLATVLVGSACSSGGPVGVDSPAPAASNRAGPASSTSDLPAAMAQGEPAAAQTQPEAESSAAGRVDENPDGVDLEAPETGAESDAAESDAAESDAAESDAPEPGRLEIVEATLSELGRALSTGLVTPTELLERYRARIAAYDDAGPALNAYLRINEEALADAEALGRRCEDPVDAPPLCGIPVVLKDNVDALGLPTTAGSLALATAQPLRDAFVTRRLREAGAILIGKATLTELANFLTTAMPAGYSSLGGFGFNPYDPRPVPNGDGRPVLSPGGSSSGPAIAVSANLAAVGVGTETSGSILSPASSNGIVGIKPTLGLISRAGIVPISADQDTAGPFARSVADAALVLGVLSGFDEADPATAVCLEPGRCPSDYTPFLDAGALLGARIAVPPVPGARRGVMQAAIDVLEAEGAQVESIDALPAQRGTCTSDPPGNACSIVLTYGFKRDLNAYFEQTPGTPATLADLIAFNASTDGALEYGQRLALVAEALDVSEGSADSARYQSDRSRALDSARSALDSVYLGADGIAGSADDVDALLFSENGGAATPAIAGYPSITVPGGFRMPSGDGENPAPSGVTFSGPQFAESRLIALAYAFEQATRLRRPPASAPALPGDVIDR